MDEKTLEELEEFANRKGFLLTVEEGEGTAILREESTFLKLLKMARAILAYSQDDPPLRNSIIGIAVCYGRLNSGRF